MVLSRAAIPVDTSASWSYDASLPAATDGVTTQLRLYGYDSVGNRSDATIISYAVDNVAPVITATGALTQVAATFGLTATEVLSGSVSDGSGLRTMYATVQAPTRSYVERVVVADTASLAQRRVRPASTAANWSYFFQPTEYGDHSISVVAQDAAGNATAVGPYVVSVPAQPAAPTVYQLLIFPIYKEFNIPPILAAGSTGAAGAPTPANSATPKRPDPSDRTDGATPTATAMAARTSTGTSTATPTGIRTATATATASETPVATATPSGTPVATATPSATRSATATATAVLTATATSSVTPMAAPIGTATAAKTPSATSTPTATPSPRASVHQKQGAAFTMGLPATAEPILYPLMPTWRVS
ncbi:MAG: hypothetical protein HYX94_02855 [Chloroflexi bacterium]|nr:hypothetical protein [Chloroflexota bacterium]